MQQREREDMSNIKWTTENPKLWKKELTVEQKERWVNKSVAKS